MFKSVKKSLIFASFINWNFYSDEFLSILKLLVLCENREKGSACARFYFARPSSLLFCEGPVATAAFFGLSHDDVPYGRHCHAVACQTNLKMATVAWMGHFWTMSQRQKNFKNKTRNQDHKTSKRNKFTEPKTYKIEDEVIGMKGLCMLEILWIFAKSLFNWNFI